MQTNDIVKYSVPMADEIGMTYRILEVNGDRVIIQAIVKNLVFCPTYIALISDLELV